MSIMFHLIMQTCKTSCRHEDLPCGRGQGGASAAVGCPGLTIWPMDSVGLSGRHSIRDAQCPPAVRIGGFAPSEGFCPTLENVWHKPRGKRACQGGESAMGAVDSRADTIASPRLRAGGAELVRSALAVTVSRFLVGRRPATRRQHRPVLLRAVGAT